jgi:hypothetical protein
MPMSQCCATQRRWEISIDEIILGVIHTLNGARRTVVVGFQPATAVSGPLLAAQARPATVTIGRRTGCAGESLRLRDLTPLRVGTMIARHPDSGGGPMAAVARALVCSALVGLCAARVLAFSSGIASTQFGSSGCNDCHSGGNRPDVTLDGPTIVAPDDQPVHAAGLYLGRKTRAA